MPKQKELRTSGNIYIGPTIKDFKTHIEEAEQAYVGVTDMNGNPISEYLVRGYEELAVKLGLNLDAE